MENLPELSHVRKSMAHRRVQKLQPDQASRGQCTLGCLINTCWLTECWPISSAEGLLSSLSTQEKAENKPSRTLSSRTGLPGLWNNHLALQSDQRRAAHKTAAPRKHSHQPLPKMLQHEKFLFLRVRIWALGVFCHNAEFLQESQCRLEISSSCFKMGVYQVVF